MGFEEDTKGALGTRPDADLQIKLRAERLRIDEGPHIVKQMGIGNAFILGHATNGKLGVANGIGGGQITLGGGGLDTPTLERVVNQRNTFKEYLRYTDLVDTTNTTATVNTTDHKIEF